MTLRKLSCLALLALGCAVPTFAAPATKPNILLILVDDMGFSDLGAYGGEVPTPNLDKLAGEGLRFTRCYNSARCCPSRAALLTGVYPHDAGVGSMAGEIQPDQPAVMKGPIRPYGGSLNERTATLAEVLGSAGYGTYMIGKWHVSGRGPIKRGFKEFYGFPNGYAQDMWDPKAYVRLPENRKPELTYAPGKFYQTDVFTDYAIEFLKQAREEKGKPWFMYLAYGAAHFPLQAPEGMMEQFLPTYRRGWDVLREERFERMKKIGLADDTWKFTPRSQVPVDVEVVANGFAGEQNPAWESLPEDRREDLAHRMALYAAMLSSMDKNVGRILDDLKKNGQLDNTLILFMSDNGACYEWGPFGFDVASRKGVTELYKGEDLKKMGGPGTYISYGSAWANLCNTPFRMYKHFTYEGGICSPMIVHWPDGLGGRTGWVRDAVHLIDVMPTLCEVAGAKYPTKREGNTVLPERGESIVPLFKGGKLAQRSLGFEHEKARAFWSDPWKLVMSKRTGGEPKWELYNIEKDRCETENLAEKYPDITKQLAAKWQAWAENAHVFRPDEEPKAPPKPVAPQID